MTILNDAHIISRQAWKNLAETSPVASWFQTPEAYDFLSSVAQCLTPFVLAIEDNGLKGLMVGYTVANPGLQRAFTARTIINGGPLLAEDISDEALTMLLNAVPKSAIYSETRNFADYSRWSRVFEQCGWKYEPHYDVVINVDSSWRERLADDKKQQIRKAQKDGQTWALAQNEDEVRVWYYDLLRLYRNKVHRPLLPLSFFITAWRTDKCKVLVVRDKYNNIIGGSLLPVMGKTAYEWYKSGTVMSTFAILEWCEKEGLTCLDCMGAGTPGIPYGVRDFKLRMGGELRELGRFVRVQKPLRYKLGVAVVKKLL